MFDGLLVQTEQVALILKDGHINKIIVFERKLINLMNHSRYNLQVV